MDAMLAEMSSADLAEWEAYYSLEPWGSPVDDLRAGQIAATVANAHRDTKVRPQGFTAFDFFPSRIPAEEPSIEDKIHAAFRPLAVPKEK